MHNNYHCDLIQTQYNNVYIILSLLKHKKWKIPFSFRRQYSQKTKELNKIKKLKVVGGIN